MTTPPPIAPPAVDLKLHARRLYDLGLNITVIKSTGTHPYKNPIHKWKQYHSRRQTPEEFERLPWTHRDLSGIGLVHIEECEATAEMPRAVCLDLDDVLRGEKGALLFSPVERLLDGLRLPHTYPWIVRTGDGYHVWICTRGALPPDFLTAKKGSPGCRTGQARLETFDHLEVRHERLQSLIPPSMHHTGRRYAWLGPAPSSPPFEVPVERLVEAVYAVCKRPSKKKPRAHRTPRRNGQTASVVSPERLRALAVEQVERGDDTRNNMGLWLACQLRDNGFDQDDALEEGRAFVEAVAHHKNGDPYTFDEYEHSVEQAYSRAPRDAWPSEAANYFEERGCLYRQSVGGGPQKIADFTAEITREITSEDDARLYQIEGRTSTGRAFTAEVGAEAFEDARRLGAALGAAAGAEAAVQASMGKHLPPAIKARSRNVARIRRFERTGWVAGVGADDDVFLLPGRAFDGLDIVERAKPPYAWANAEADLGDGLEALDSLMRAMTPGMMTVCLSFVLTGPVAPLAGLTNGRYALFIRGRTGSFKTTLAQLLMGLYGDGFRLDASLIKWGEGATRNAIMAHATYARNLPLLVDNYKPSTGGGDRQFINVIHNILEGGDRDRCNRDGTLRRSKLIEAWPLATGEDLPDTDPASLARCLTLEFSWERGRANPDLTHAQTFAEHLPAVGTAWIRWLESDDGRTAAREEAVRFPESRRAWAAALNRERTDMINPMRVASSLAANVVVFNIAKRCDALAPLLTRHEADYRSGLQAVAREMATLTAEALEAHRFLSGLKSLIATEQVFFADRSIQTTLHESERIRLCGWFDSEGYYLDFDRCLSEVETLLRRSGGLGGLSKRTLGSQLKGMGLIARHDKASKTRVVNCQGSNCRVLHLKREALDEPSPSQHKAHAE